jgi:hypothetical protein
LIEFVKLLCLINSLNINKQLIKNEDDGLNDDGAEPREAEAAIPWRQG